MDPFKKAARGQGAVELDLSIAAILNALGALAFAIVGAASLAVARGSVRGRIVGAIALVFGTRLVLSNLVILGLPGDPITHGVLDLAQIALVARLCSDLARDLAPARRRLVVLLSIGVALAVAWDVRTFVTADYAAAPTGETLATDSSPTSFLLATSSFIVLAFVCALRALDAENQARTERRAMAFLALAFGIFPSAWLPPLSLDGANAPLMALYVVSFLPWLALTRGSEPALGRLGLLTLVAAALVGTIVTGPVKDALHDTSLSDYGVPGVARMVGVVFLVLAIVRYDLYGVELPAFATRGATGTVALAALVIVAQVAQNFLAAQYSQYGFVLGGVVAGAFLLASKPIERALERSAPAATNERLDVYRDAVRRSLRDGIVTREEEMHLARLARHMSVAHDDAVRIRHEIEDEVRDRSTEERPQGTR